MRRLLPGLLLGLLCGCTHAAVSTTPIQLADGSEGYRYSGRANFGYQMSEADRFMAETCAKMGLRPIIISQDNRTIGTGAMISGGPVTLGANQQQDIIFKCK
ncbi:MAG: hypothetical protein WAT09_12975 [Paracoccaceae bacterium]